ncbi:MAG: TonB-dependent receptor [Hyphomicrobium sp.]
MQPNLTLSNQTRWSQTDRTARFTYVASYAPASELVTTNLQFYDRENTSLSNQTNLSGRFVAAGLRHTFSTGVELTREESDANRQQQVAGGTTDIFDPNPYRTNHAPLGLAARERNAVDIDTVAAYFYDTIELSRHWEVVGGLRAEHYDVEVSNKTAAGAPASAIDGYSQDETTLGGKIGVVYKPVEEGSLYVSYGVSSPAARLAAVQPRHIPRKATTRSRALSAAPIPSSCITTRPA